MAGNLRTAWTHVVKADELDIHLDAIGQAEVNAEIVEKMISDFPLPKGSKLLMPGCGTGQIFNYISHKVLSCHKLVFTDINRTFLDALSERLSGTEIWNFSCHIDDLEGSVLSERFDGIIPVLVLEQLEWEKAIQTMVGFMPTFIYLIIQEQSSAAETIRVHQKLPDSMKRFSEMAEPRLVPRDDLIGHLSAENYRLNKVYEQQVPNNKVMAGLVFEKLAEM